MALCMKTHLGLAPDPRLTLAVTNSPKAGEAAKLNSTTGQKLHHRDPGSAAMRAGAGSWK